MKITCVKDRLQEASLLSERITGHNPTLPILSAVLISTENKRLKFSSTNLEMGLEVTIPAKIEKEGKVAVPAKLFSNFISSLPDNENIKFETVKNNLVLTTKSTSTTIRCYPVDDFPLLPKIEQKKSFIVSVFDFILGLKSVYYSASLSEMKPEINSVFVSSSGKNPLTFVATDIFRLARKIIPYNFSNSPSFLVPYRSVIEILRVFEKRQGDLEVKLDENNIVLSSGGINFTSRLTEGSFVDYTQIVPTKFTNTITVDKKQLNNALKTAIMFCGKLNEIKIKIYKNEDFMEIQTKNPELGEHIVSVPAKTDGGDLTMVFNHRYLLDCLPSLNSEKILLKFSGEQKPLFVTCLNDNSFYYLIMPMKDL